MQLDRISIYGCDSRTTAYPVNISKGINLSVHVAGTNFSTLLPGDKLLLETLAVSRAVASKEAPYNPVSMLYATVKNYTNHAYRKDQKYKLKQLSDFGDLYAPGYIYSKQGNCKYTRKVFPLPVFLTLTAHAVELEDYLSCDATIQNLLYDNKVELKDWLRAWANWASRVLERGYIVVDKQEETMSVALSDAFTAMLQKYSTPTQEKAPADQAVIVLPPRAADDSFTQAERFAIETNAVVDFSIPFNASAEQLQGLWTIIHNEVHTRYPELETVTLKENRLIVTYEGVLGERLDNFYVQIEEVQRAVLRILHACQGAFE